MQILMFLDAAEVSPTFTGPRWLANPVSWVVGVVVGGLMGYEVSYEEYYSEKGGGGVVSEAFFGGGGGWREYFGIGRACWKGSAST